MRSNKNKFAIPSMSSNVVQLMNANVIPLMNVSVPQ